MKNVETNLANASLRIYRLLGLIALGILHWSNLAWGQPVWGGETVYGGIKPIIDEDSIKAGGVPVNFVLHLESSMPLPFDAVIIEYEENELPQRLQEMVNALRSNGIITLVEYSNLRGSAITVRPVHLIVHE